MTLAEKTLEIALTQVGFHEQPFGSNSGPEVDEYLRSVHLPPGNPWCAAFVGWCFTEAVKVVGGPPWFRPSGGAIQQYFTNVHLAIDSPGDQPCIFIKEGSDHVHGHTGFVIRVRPDGLFDTVEGNSNSAGARNGDSVVLHTRSPGEIRYYLQII